MSDLGWIEIPSWDRYQHADVTRGSGVAAPPWIKNYTRLLSDDDYLELAPGTRAVLHGLWLLYASIPPRDGLVTGSTPRRLRADTGSLTRRLNLRVTSAQLFSLEQAGFIRVIASTGHADDTPRTRAGLRGEVEVEVEEPPTHLAKGHSGRVGGDQHKDFDLPSPIDRPELEPDNGVSRLSPHEELLLKKGNVPF